MQDSQETKKFLENFYKQLPQYIELKNTFLIKQNFILAFGKKQNITFDNSENFNQFCNFIENTKYQKEITINKNKKEISISKDIPQIFYNILYEFLI